jgi:antitoxin MazE
MSASTIITRIGNSKGIRIPAAILDTLNLRESDSVKLEVQDGKLVVIPINKARKGWSEAFKKMHKNGDDNLIDIPDLEDDIW